MWNDKETDIDLLGHDKIAQTIIEIINDSHLRPLTVGVYGDWGVGKSSVLSLLQKKVKDENSIELSNSHCIVFNGWLFQGYEDTKTALMETVITELARLQPRHKKVQKIAKSLIRRVNWLKVAKFSAGALVTGLSGIPDPGLMAGMVRFLGKSKAFLENPPVAGISEVGKEIDDKPFFNEEEDTVTSQIHTFRKEFKELIVTSKVDHIIVLVDDLDRCLPKAVIDILEAIRLFLFVDGTTFVISADEKMIEYSVREHFPNLPTSYADYTKNYLEKLIQVPIRIPMLSSLQTANYIKFLLLQFHLKHDFVQLETVYSMFAGKRKTPYENFDLSYQIIVDALGYEDVNLSETILVGDQLSPTLSSGLKGNPRNIKRFLNTLFLRIRIAKIYGLDQIVKLNVLAKLMLLERFQSDRFDVLVEEVSSSSNGIVSSINNLEEEWHKMKAAEINDADNKLAKTFETDKSERQFADWIKLMPQLGGIDLRPYIFISKEKAIGFDSDVTFPDHLSEILALLNSNSEINLQKAEKQLSGVGISDSTLLFNKLESESRSVSDLKDVPPPIKGLFRIISVYPTLEHKLVSLINTYPSTNLGVWAISQFSGLKDNDAIAAYKKLLITWSSQTSNKMLQAMAKQTIKTL